MDEWVISPLSKTHDRAGFSCGKAPFDAFMRLHVTQYEKRRLARTYVATETGEEKVAGYFSLANGSLEPSDLPVDLRRKLPNHRIPTVHLARLAVDLEFRDRRLGETLLMNALNTALELSDRSGAFGVDVWAIDDEAAAFYRKYGFKALEDHPHHLLLSLKTVAATPKK
jgi:ribosomal protein S18 acetylase RimI-like enzyme